MLKRALIGLVKGVVVGGLLALLLVKGFGLSAFGALLAYIFAVVTGALMGLVAGRPIWAEGARIEAGLKAFVGALIAAGAMFVLRKWVGVQVDLGAFGNGALGELPITSLPLIATGLALLFEIDNTGEAPVTDADLAKKKQRVDAAALGEASVDDLVEDEAEAPAPARRKN